MKKNFLTKVVSLGLATVLSIGLLAGCGDSNANTSAPAGTEAGTTDAPVADAPAAGGTIMWMSNLSSGAQYEAQKALAEDYCAKLGYKLTIVYGDGFNDPQGNLTAVKNGMTKDVVGLIASQDGGIVNIMDEYPDLWVAGFNSDMNSVYSEVPDFATSAAVKEKDHWLGTIADGMVNGFDAAKDECDFMLEKGYKKVAIVNFPFYAYPHQAEQVQATLDFCAQNGIEVVGEPLTLEFQPLDVSFFQQPGMDDLDAVVAICAGTTFVYSTMLQAKQQGLCAEKTVMLTGGFDSDQAILDDIGENGTIAFLTISPNEDIMFAITLLDKAIKGEMYSDFQAEQLDSQRFIITSQEDVTNTMTKSSMTGDASKAQITADDFQACQSYAELVELIHSEKATAAALR